MENFKEKENVGNGITIIRNPHTCEDCDKKGETKAIMTKQESYDNTLCQYCAAGM